MRYTYVTGVGIRHTGNLPIYNPAFARAPIVHRAPCPSSNFHARAPRQFYATFMALPASIQLTLFYDYLGKWVVLLFRIIRFPLPILNRILYPCSADVCG